MGEKHIIDALFRQTLGSDAMAIPKTVMSCGSCGAKKTNIFCDLAPELAGELNQIKKSHFYKKKQILCYEGNPATGIYCIESGRVKVFKTSPDGKQYINFLATTGDVLGVEGILLHNDYVATAEMLSPNSFRSAVILR